MPFYSPLRYPGGKGKLAPFLGEIIRENKLVGRKYFEFYAGGAGVALYLLINKLVSEIYINDIDIRIYAFWHSILNNSREFIERIYNCKIDMDEWHRHKEICSKPETYSMLELGFSTFFLNRTNRSGIIDGGVIGGKKQDGKYKMDVRFNRAKLAVRISKIASLKKRIKLFCLDACELLEREQLNSAEYIFYFDPPYYVPHQQLYSNFYKSSDHAKLAALIRDLGTPWLLTYNDCDEIKNIYSGCANAVFTIAYNAQIKRQGREIIYYGNLSLPLKPYAAKNKRNL